jgi:hypothetical protein
MFILFLGNFAGFSVMIFFALVLGWWEDWIEF